MNLYLLNSLFFLLGGYNYLHIWKPCVVTALETLRAQPDYVRINFKTTFCEFPGENVGAKRTKPICMH